MELSYLIKDYIKSKTRKCKIFPAPYAVFLNESGTKYVEPDISVICDLSKLDNKGCHGAPDWIIEIVSPSSKRMDYFIKLFQYQTAGVREYWIVDPIKNIITTYDFELEDIADYTFTDKIKVNIYEDLVIDFGELDT